MCRSIKVLRKRDLIVTPEDVSAAALQFVRKVSGFHKPSKANQAVFDDAVREVANSTEKLLERLGSGVVTRASPSFTPQGIQRVDS